MKLFGFEFKRLPKEEPPSFIPPINDDGAAIVSAFGSYGQVVDLDGTVRTEAELITKYRELSLQPEIDQAIENIVDEAIVQDDVNPIVQLMMEDAPLDDGIKDVIQEEFDNILKLIKFNVQAYDLFKRYYIDGRLYFHVLVDEKLTKEGIQELRYIDPRKIRKVKEVQKVRDKINPDLIITKVKSEYYIYNEGGFNKTKNQNTTQGSASVAGIRISKDAIVQVVSGLQDNTGSMVLSYLHQSIRPMNQLRALEDATLIYRISRAPERRVFYIDVGNLPKAKAEQVVRDMMVKHKNRTVYDASSGEIKDDRKFMTMIEDYWMPRRADGKSTEITTLPAGQNLGELADVEYFQKRLFKSLKVPIGRLDSEQVYSIGRGSEIAREEVMFSKFIDRLRMRFSDLFLSILEKQLILKMIITPEDWDVIKPCIKFKYARDTYTTELKEAEILNSRLGLLGLVAPYAGTYFSHTWVRKHIIRQTDEDIIEIDREIAAEMQIPQYNQMLMPQPLEGEEPPNNGGKFGQK